MAASAIVPGDSGENTAEKEDGKLSLRMKLVTPVDEVNSDCFSLQSKSPQSPSLCHVTTMVLHHSPLLSQNHRHQKKEEPQ